MGTFELLARVFSRSNPLGRIVFWLAVVGGVILFVGLAVYAIAFRSWLAGLAWFFMLLWLISEQRR